MYVCVGVGWGVGQKWAGQTKVGGTDKSGLDRQNWIGQTKAGGIKVQSDVT